MYQGWTDYSHVYVEFYSETLNRPLIYEAVGSGVRFVGQKYWQKHAQEVVSYTIQVQKSNYVAMMQWCVDHEGTDYGFMQNIGIFISNIFGWKKNPWRKGSNCSEIIAEILKLEGYKINKDSNLLTPRDIEKILTLIK
jgi:uncharacterized protein YycO